MSGQRALAALAAAAYLALSPGSALAQMASYCDGRLVALSFSSREQVGNPTVTVTYFAKLQNTTNASLQFRVSFRGTPSLQGWVTVPAKGQAEVNVGGFTMHKSSLPPGGTLAENTTDAKDPRGVPYNTTVQCMIR